MALGLLAGVVLSMAGLIVVGTRWVASGRHGSEATALARDVIEEIDAWGFRQTYLEFGCAPGTAMCDVVSTHPRMAAWGAAAAHRLGGRLEDGGRIGLRIEPVAAASLSAASVLRITVLIEWEEGARSRSMRLIRVRS